MNIGTVKFPNTPEQTLEVISEFKPLITSFANEVGNPDIANTPNEMLAVMWHGFNIDFIELVDADKRVGLLMTFIQQNETRSATISLAYLEPEYRGRGLFKEMLEYTKTVYKARQFDHLDISVNADISTNSLGALHHKVYRMGL